MHHLFLDKKPFRRKIWRSKNCWVMKRRVRLLIEFTIILLILQVPRCRNQSSSFLLGTEAHRTIFSPATWFSILTLTIVYTMKQKKLLCNLLDYTYRLSPATEKFNFAGRKKTKVLRAIRWPKCNRVCFVRFSCIWRFGFPTSVLITFGCMSTIHNCLFYHLHSLQAIYDVLVNDPKKHKNYQSRRNAFSSWQNNHTTRGSRKAKELKNVSTGMIVCWIQSTVSLFSLKSIEAQSPTSFFVSRFRANDCSFRLCHFMSKSWDVNLINAVQR